MCCKAFARQFPLLSTGHCSFLLLNLPPFSCFFLSLSISFSLSFLLVQVPFSFFFSSPPPLLNTALTGGEAGLFLHDCQVLFLHLASIIPGPLHESSTLSFHPNHPPLGVVSGVGPSLCAKVPPVYRAPDFPPAFLSTGLLSFHFLTTFFKKIFFLLLSLFSGNCFF